MKEKFDEKYQKLNSKQNIFLGITSGIIDVSLTQPLVYWKVASQQKLRFTLNPNIFYRGTFTNMISMSILTGLQFPLTAFSSKLITNNINRRLSDDEIILSGFIGGSLSGIVCAPMELLMIQQQRYGGSLINTSKIIKKKYGLKKHFRGLITSCGREGIYTAGYLGLGPAITRKLDEEYDYSKTTNKIIGAIGGGVIASTLSHPLDTCKTCMQGDIDGKKYKTTLKTLLKLKNENGISSLFRGYYWRTGKIICTVFILNECKHILSPLFFPDIFN
jgi:solute carrier family 25 (mitochondrial carnitine/acylcarnitine transporter), member 20/29